MERKPQNLQNHAKFDPLFHFFLAPVGLIFLIGAIYHAVQHPSPRAYMYVAVMFWAFLAVFKVRLYSLKVHDRVIRLEQRLRMAVLLPEPLKSKSAALTESQYIALRFASDAELSALVEKTLADNLKQKEIKQAIQSWQPDYWRV